MPFLGEGYALKIPCVALSILNYLAWPRAPCRDSTEKCRGGPSAVPVAVVSTALNSAEIFS